MSSTTTTTIVPPINEQATTPTINAPITVPATGPAATPDSRNRAIDAYRAGAMIAVALGHWMAADVRLSGGKLVAGNALDHLVAMHALTWVFQVMPVFFCIGGYANAASLDAHRRAGRPDSAWVRARLLRLTTPTVWLAGTWLALLTVGSVLGLGGLAAKAVGVAAIPLWFLANYVADTALAPTTLSAYRRHGARFVGALAVLFCIGEAARFPGIHYVPQINIVIGWLLFQVLGFAWKDGHLPTGGRLLRIGVGSWTVAGLLVAFGPWPLAMVSVPGARFANTWPPSLALMAYGLGLCSFAIAAAPSVDRFLAAHRRAWTAVIVANTMTMTSYLWHFTALAASALCLAQLHLLPTAPIGSGSWWLQKLPLMGLALVFLAGLIALLSPKERAALITRAPGIVAGVDPVSTRRLVALAGLGLAASFELWTAAEGAPRLAVPGMVGVLAIHHALARTKP